MASLKAQVAALRGALAEVQGGQDLRQCHQLSVARAMLRERIGVLEGELEEAREARAERGLEDDDAAAAADDDEAAATASLEDQIASARLQLHIAEDELNQRLSHLQLEEAEERGWLVPEEGEATAPYEEFVLAFQEVD